MRNTLNLIAATGIIGDLVLILITILLIVYLTITVKKIGSLINNRRLQIIKDQSTQIKDTLKRGKHYYW